jgi:TBC1 domain family member 1
MLLIILFFKGVPQNEREKIWFWLIKQYRLRNKGIKYTEENLKVKIPYKDLLKESSIHQHAILLDLNRTFPTHPNFSKKFGPGQLALFNVLKAYSIMDNEVGYCQGLSFIVGIILIHVNNDEEKAFEMLKFLLIDLNFRDQYKPNMKMLQKHMYQFTRLQHDLCPEIYSHLNINEISSALYAAPWFLTLFTSQFQIGFVARVFDFIFAEGITMMFKMSLAILSIHEAIILSCDSFEAVVNHIKLVIPEMSLIETELLIKKAYNYDINSNLKTYEIEFQIFYEEILNIQNRYMNSLPSSFNKIDQIPSSLLNNEKTPNQIEIENVELKKHLKYLSNKIQILELQIRNQDDYFYKLQRENNQLKCKVDTLEIERTGVLRKVSEQEKEINLKQYFLDLNSF